MLNQSWWSNSIEGKCAPFQIVHNQNKGRATANNETSVPNTDYAVILQILWLKLNDNLNLNKSYALHWQIFTVGKKYVSTNLRSSVIVTKQILNAAGNRKFSARCYFQQLMFHSYRNPQNQLNAFYIMEILLLDGLKVSILINHVWNKVSSTRIEIKVFLQADMQHTKHKKTSTHFFDKTLQY